MYTQAVAVKEYAEAQWCVAAVVAKAVCPDQSQAHRWLAAGSICSAAHTASSSLTASGVPAKQRVSSRPAPVTSCCCMRRMKTRPLLVATWGRVQAQAPQQADEQLLEKARALQLSHLA